MKQAHIFVSGFVQGVGFRQFIKRKARTLRVNGWVKNLPDRRVEAMLQGRMEDVKKMILLCKKGPFLSQVQDVQVLWEESEKEYTDFEVY